MLLPLGDDHVKGKHKPVFTYLLILVNCYVFWHELQMSPEGLQGTFYNYGAVPETLLRGQNVHTLLTSIFLHGGWMHLVGNMLFLWIFADNIEVTIGNFRFLLFYLAGGAFAILFHCFFFQSSQIPAIGASGAIAATLGAYLVMFPSSRIRVFFFFFFFRVSAFVFLGFWILQQLFAGWESLTVQSADTVGIGYWAHIGGFAYGLICGVFYRRQFTRAFIKY